MVRVGQSTYGHSALEWNSAKDEAIQAMRAVARKAGVIFYSELTAAISSIKFDPHGVPFSHFLGEISIAEFEAGRGMMTAIVVHKDGDRKPGPGFYECAHSLGLDTSDKVRLWTDQVNKVYESWAR